MSYSFRPMVPISYFLSKAVRYVVGVRLLPAKGSPQRTVVLVSLAAFLTIVFPFFFWFLTWHGWALDPVQIESGLADPVRPGYASQQIMLIGEKLSRGDTSPQRWYPRIIQLGKHSDEDLRRNVAWVMGKDPASSAFRDALHVLLRDSAPLVRLEAALSLAEFRDSSAREELTVATQPFRVPSTAAGHVQMRIDVGDAAKSTTVIARIDGIDVTASVPGMVKQLLAADGQEVVKGQALIAIERDMQQVREARRALRLIETH